MVGGSISHALSMSRVTPLEHSTQEMLMSSQACENPFWHSGNQQVMLVTGCLRHQMHEAQDHMLCLEHE